MPSNTRPRVFTTKPVEVTSPVEIPEPDKPADFHDEFDLMTTDLNLPVITEVYETIVLRVPKAVFDEYSALSAAQDMTVEELMQYRLSSCKNHNALRGLWFSDSERTQLENIIQKWPLESASQALSLLKRAGTIKFDDIQVPLTPAQKKVLGMALYGGRTPESFFAAMVRRELRT